MQDGTFLSPGHPLETRLRGDVFCAACPTRQLLDRIADKWSTLILIVLQWKRERPQTNGSTPPEAADAPPLKTEANG